MTPERIRKGAATKLGVSLEEYDRRVGAGEFWCSGCQMWHARERRTSTRGYCAEATRRRRASASGRRRSQEWNDRLARLLVK